ncbi:MAG: hypothetical protein JSS09_08855 [Verrucomicrobia bacterium]|nr:hypothetical protein [Verrucomicrobiota bacterium]
MTPPFNNLSYKNKLQSDLLEIDQIVNNLIESSLKLKDLFDRTNPTIRYSPTLSDPPSSNFSKRKHDEIPDFDSYVKWQQSTLSNRPVTPSDEVLNTIFKMNTRQKP